MTIIRPERPEDFEAIDAVHAGGFPTPAEAGLVRLLRQAGRLTTSLVAEVDGEVVGHVAFSPVSTTSGAEGAGLAPVSVAPAHRRRGIAAQLIEAGLSDEYDGGDAFQAIELTPDTLPRGAGLVRYAPEFASLEE